MKLTTSINTKFIFTTLIVMLLSGCSINEDVLRFASNPIEYFDSPNYETRSVEYFSKIGFECNMISYYCSSTLRTLDSEYRSSFNYKEYTYTTILDMRVNDDKIFEVFEIDLKTGMVNARGTWMSNTPGDVFNAKFQASKSIITDKFDYDYQYVGWNYFVYYPEELIKNRVDGSIGVIESYIKDIYEISLIEFIKTY